MGWRRKSNFEFEGANDIVGIVMLEKQSADDLPRLANSEFPSLLFVFFSYRLSVMRTGWDMDPFVVLSFGKKVFRTRVIRQSRSPVCDEKMLFHVRRYETAFRIQLTVLDWDKLSSNDHVGDAGLDLKELIEGAPQPDPVTGLYKLDGTEGTNAQEEGMKEFSRPLVTEKGVPWEAKHSPVIQFKYVHDYSTYIYTYFIYSGQNISLMVRFAGASGGSTSNNTTPTTLQLSLSSNLR